MIFTRFSTWKIFLELVLEKCEGLEFHPLTGASAMRGVLFAVGRFELESRPPVVGWQYMESGCPFRCVNTWGRVTDRLSLLQSTLPREFCEVREQTMGRTCVRMGSMG